MVFKKGSKTCFNLIEFVLKYSIKTTREVFLLKWDEVRKLHPNQWVKLKVLDSHIDEDYLYIDEIEVIRTIEDDKTATMELTKSTGNNIVFHTSHEMIKTKLIKKFGLFRSNSFPLDIQ